MKSIIYAFVMVGLVSYNLSAQSSTSSIPVVFELGQNEKDYEQLGASYSQSILEVAGNDLELAFTKWLDLMTRMEDYADRISYDIKGLKVWMHVFWSADGSIDHIGYIMREDSRNFAKQELEAFFKTFASKEKIDLKSNKSFSFYTGATFPVYAEKYSDN
jgi:hypothetical protein